VGIEGRTPAGEQARAKFLSLEKKRSIFCDNEKRQGGRGTWGGSPNGKDTVRKKEI